MTARDGIGPELLSLTDHQTTIPDLAQDFSEPSTEIKLAWSIRTCQNREDLHIQCSIYSLDRDWVNTNLTFSGWLYGSLIVESSEAMAGERTKPEGSDDLHNRSKLRTTSIASGAFS